MTRKKRRAQVLVKLALALGLLLAAAAAHAQSQPPWRPNGGGGMGGSGEINYLRKANEWLGLDFAVGFADADVTSGVVTTEERADYTRVSALAFLNPLRHVDSIQETSPLFSLYVGFGIGRYSLENQVGSEVEAHYSVGAMLAPGSCHRWALEARYTWSEVDLTAADAELSGLTVGFRRFFGGSRELSAAEQRRATRCSR